MQISGLLEFRYHGHISVCFTFVCVLLLLTNPDNPLVHEDIFKHDQCFHRFNYHFVSGCYTETCKKYSVTVIFTIYFI